MFERFMNSELCGLKWDIFLCYLGDVFGKTFNEHNERLASFLECLHKAGIILSSKECHFRECQALVLRHLINEQGMRPYPEKTAAVQSFKTLQTVKEVCFF